MAIKKNKLKIYIKKLFEYLFLPLIIIYEEIFIKIAILLKKIFYKINLYNKIIKFFTQNLFLMLLFFIITIIIAEIVAILAGYFLLNKHYIIGIFLYSLKIILFIPIVDIFKKEKKTLLKYSIIRKPYILYIKFKRSIFYKNIKKYKNKIKSYLKEIKIIYKSWLKIS